MEKNESKINFINMPAVKISVKQINSNLIDRINNYIDTNELKDSSDSLVGQISQNEKSSQLNMVLSDEVPALLGESILEMAKQHANITQNIHVRKSLVEAMWTVKSYAGDYNPLHCHTLSSKILKTGDVHGLSCILYLKVPECLEKTMLKSDSMAPNGVSMSYSLNNASGDCDGFTHFVWGNYNDTFDFRERTDTIVQPQEGLLLMFPMWLGHIAYPFFGEGERRTLSANIAIFV